MISIILALSLAVSAPTPEKAVEEFFNNFDSGKFDAAWEMLTPQSAEFLEKIAVPRGGVFGEDSMSTSLPQGKEAFATMGAEIQSKLSLMPDTILGSVIKDNHGYVVVEYDLERMMNQALSGSGEILMAKAMLNQLPSKTIIWTWETEKIGNNWRFDLGIINTGIAMMYGIFGAMMPPDIDTPAESGLETPE